jgi:hypothetical protein
MKKVILFIFMTGLLFAQNQSDIAFTAGYNKFDDPLMLREHRGFYGIRGGVYQDNGFGLQLGYEQANGANCQGLDLKRYYANALLQSTQAGKLKPYGLLSLGYETSNIHEHKPDQTFIGAGVGVRYALAQNVNGFIETRVLRKLKSDDTDIITTLGLAYVLNNNISMYPQQRAVYTPRVQPEVLTPVIEETRYQQRAQPAAVYVEPYVEPYQERVAVETQKDYYVQLGAFASTNPDAYVQKLYSRGIDNVQVKQVVRGGRSISLVVVGPYYDRRDATKNLRRLKRVNRGAFITKL